MGGMPDVLTVDDLTFAIRWSRRRRSIGIAVDRGGGLTLAVPAGCSRRRLETAVRGKLPWVRRKLGEMALLGPPPAPPAFVDGELWPYLGRQHRLRLVDAPPAAVRLHRGWFEMDRALVRAGDAGAHQRAWYVEHARQRLEARTAAFAPRLGAAPAAVRVRDLGARWGSCSAAAVIALHWSLVLMPPHIADYVIVHELAHLRELNHSPAFWRVVEEAMPDYRERRSWLKANGHRFGVAPR